METGTTLIQMSKSTLSKLEPQEVKQSVSETVL